jgi:hypothetical protein
MSLRYVNHILSPHVYIVQVEKYRWRARIECSRSWVRLSKKIKKTVMT